MLAMVAAVLRRTRERGRETAAADSSVSSSRDHVLLDKLQD